MATSRKKRTLKESRGGDGERDGEAQSHRAGPIKKKRRMEIVFRVRPSQRKNAVDTFNALLCCKDYRRLALVPKGMDAMKLIVEFSVVRYVKCSDFYRCKKTVVLQEDRQEWRSDGGDGNCHYVADSRGKVLYYVQVVNGKVEIVCRRCSRDHRCCDCGALRFHSGDDGIHQCGGGCCENVCDDCASDATLYEQKDDGRVIGTSPCKLCSSCKDTHGTKVYELDFI